jgi:diguanylate cyclase
VQHTPPDFDPSSLPEPTESQPVSDVNGANSANSLNGLLQFLLKRIAFTAEFEKSLAALRARMDVDLSDNAQRKHAEELSDLINTQHTVLEKDKVEVQRVMGQVDSQLNEIAAYLSIDASSRQEGKASLGDFDQRLITEVRGIENSIRQATELDSVKAQVATRLSSISNHLGEYRKREESRNHSLELRNIDMRARIDDLEREASALRLSLQRERKVSLTDALTGVPNRLAYDERILEEMSRWKRYKRPIVIAAWDLDRFKSINDTYGHKAGDKVLCVVAQLLHRGLRQTDFFARYGGEEFAMVIVGAPLEEATKIADAHRKKIERLGFHFDGKPVQVTASCGITAIAEGDTPDSIFERADKALYIAKKTGRNRCVVG